MLLTYYAILGCREIVCPYRPFAIKIRSSFFTNIKVWSSWSSRKFYLEKTKSKSYISVIECNGIKVLRGPQIRHIFHAWKKVARLYKFSISFLKTSNLHTGFWLKYSFSVINCRSDFKKFYRSLGQVFWFPPTLDGCQIDSWTDEKVKVLGNLIRCQIDSCQIDSWADEKVKVLGNQILIISKVYFSNPRHFDFELAWFMKKSVPP